MGNMLQNANFRARGRAQAVWRELMRDPWRSHPDNLYLYEGRRWSQRGEDGILLEILRRLGIETGRSLEIGFDARECNTRVLHERGWQTTMVDLDAEECAATTWGHPVAMRVTTENIATLDLDVDVLSIDVDGNDSYLLEAVLDTGVRPAVVVCEYNALLPEGRSAYDPDWLWHGEPEAGTSLALLVEIAARYDYVLVACTTAGNDAFFVQHPAAAFPMAGDVERHYSSMRREVWAWTPPLRYDH